MYYKKNLKACYQYLCSFQIQNKVLAQKQFAASPLKTFSNVYLLQQRR